MKRFLFLLLSFAGFSLPGPARDVIRGFLLDQASRQAVAYATVYINGSTSGAVTDARGYFELEARSFPLELIASHLSYEPAAFSLTLAVADTLQLLLQPRAVDLEEVSVEDKDRRAANLEEFRQHFLGTDEFGEAATLRNAGVLFFQRDYEQRELPPGIRIVAAQGAQVGGKRYVERPLNLQAESRGLLLIDQPLTGYTIHVDLVSFRLDYAKVAGPGISSAWLAYYYFEPVPVKNRRQAEKLEQRRRQAYYNSGQHFLFALYHGRLAEEGYQVMERVRNDAGQVEYRPVDLEAFLRPAAGTLKEVTGLKDRLLEVFYYPGAGGRPQDVGDKAKGTPVVSQVLFTEAACSIRADGTAPRANIRFGGVIATKKAGAMLPDSYRPHDS